MSKRFFVALPAIIICLLVSALQANGQSNTTIADHLQKVTNGRVTINQPAELNKRISSANGDSTNVATNRHPRGSMNTVGYRIQVFSDRNQRTAKGEALSKERIIKGSFPDMNTYISYDAPSWRLRVGNFRTRDEAAARMAELKERFPGFANEMIIVVDVINTDAQ